ncbi:ArsR/SmtB family transcription factor [Streptomyces sp. BK79]|uniref:ArsR/SmtB family transcription factor n=1 Tax=Streptomyces sp. BK79 TaxID=3350097 RepID=UPI00376FBCE5
MPPARLAGLRWAVSPLGELAAALVAAAEAPAGDRAAQRTRALLHSGRFPVLAAVRTAFTVYLPELLTPAPRSPAPDITDQLHELARADLTRVGEQFTALTRGGSARSHRCPWLRPGQLGPARDRARLLIETSESELRERLADELHRLWTEHIAPSWPRIASGAEEFVQRQARAAADTGLGPALASLHSSLDWKGDRLDMASPYQGRVDGAAPLTLVPSFHLRRVALHAPLTGGGQLVVPVTDRGSASRPAVAPVLGATRLALLQSLAQRRTTTDLAVLHHLTPGSVSYHLSRLLAADLIRRERQGRLVYYQRTGRAQTLLRSC